MNNNGKGFIYLVHTREFINSDQNIYKIGRTRNLTRRLKSYPKGSQCLFSIQTNDEINDERNLIDIFKYSFIQRLDIGKEYFEGNIDKMMNIIENNLNEMHNVQSYVAPINITKKKIYKCDKCDKIFKQKSHYEVHINKKYPCEKMNSIENLIQQKKIINEENMKIYIKNRICIYCDKKFARKENVMYHLKNSCCKNKKIKDKNDFIFHDLKNLREQNTQIREQNKILIDKMNKMEEYMLKSDNHAKIINNDKSRTTNIDNSKHHNHLNLINYNK